MKRIIITICSCISMILSAQTDLLSEIDTANTAEYYQPSFKGLQVVTAQSTKLPTKNEFYFVVSHRFGDLSQGFNNFLGLDNATTKIGGIYGITDWFSVNLSRHTYQKTYELGAKYRLFAQSKEKNIPVDVVGYHALDINSEISKAQYETLKFSDRMSYTSQILVSRRFSEIFSLQFSPTWVHKSLYNPSMETNNQILAGIGGRYKVSKRVSINAEYFYNFSSKNGYKNPLSIGMDLETGGHVFQMMFSNSQPITEAGYLTNAAGNWTKGNIYFGFNMYRVF